MFHITDHIVCFRAHNPSPMTLDGTNCYIVSGRTAAGLTNALLIDVGPDEPAHVAAIAAYLREREWRLQGILLTHTHRDHTDGLESFHRLTAAPVHAFKSGYDHPLRDGDQVALGDRALVVIHSPGHAGDCVCFYDEREGVLFTGDTVLGVGTSVIAPPEGDVSAYLDALQRLKSFPAKVIAPGHGPIITRPRAKLDEYIEHRLMRERQIIAELQSGPKTIADLVAEIYKEVDKSLHRAAAWSVSAHLERLRQAGKVIAEADQWRLR
ncbi:MAG: MBL fold metallo-hydrolase [Chloroflexi bacterium]|nr:MBL fold metallo-hydrolase [Chloroflexota bacterium]MBI3732435.1 MBL fold metallo-hydrolase [Chloroflexota bacterium]